MVAIAIDGPAGAGKSTIAKLVAQKLGYVYVDTGALYRCIGLHAIDNSIDTKDKCGIIYLLDKINIRLKFIDGQQRDYTNDEDVTERIRIPEASMAASDVSAIPEVRDFLFDLQRDIANKNNIVMDGRDIGTVVLPNADLKIFLTATPQERARRRHLEFKNKGMDVNYDELLEEIKQRDYNDSNRPVAPLKQANDAILIDSTDISIDQVISKIMEAASKKNLK